MDPVKADICYEHPSVGEAGERAEFTEQGGGRRRDDEGEDGRVGELNWLPCRYVPATRVRELCEALADPHLQSRRVLHRHEAVAGSDKSVTVARRRRQGARWRRSRSRARSPCSQAVLLGKTSLHEFAVGVTNDNPHRGTVPEPWKLGCIPGGSAAVVASLGGWRRWAATPAAPSASPPRFAASSATSRPMVWCRGAESWPRAGPWTTEGR